MNFVSALKPTRSIAALAIASLLLMAAVDFLTGQELVFSCAYLIPVSFTAWCFSRSWMVAMASASGLTALVVDKLDGYGYSHPGAEYWNAFACFVISIVAGFVLSRLKQTLTERELANDELRSALEKLEASTAEIRKLQNGLQVVCAWTQRIKVGDDWMTPDEFLKTQLHLQLSHGISPEAYEELTKNLPSPSEILHDHAA